MFIFLFYYYYFMYIFLEWNSHCVYDLQQESSASGSGSCSSQDTDMSLPGDLMSMNGTHSKRKYSRTEVAPVKLHYQFLFTDCVHDISSSSFSSLCDAEDLPPSFLPHALEPAESLKASFTANNLNGYQSARPIYDLNIPVKPGLTVTESETIPNSLPLNMHTQHKGIRLKTIMEDYVMI